MSGGGWNWLSPEDIRRAHDGQIARHGGLPGIRDVGAVEAAADRPRNVAAYRADADAADLSAALAFGIARGHPFADGNKRTAWVAVRLFLMANGRRMYFDGRDAEETVVSLAEGRLSEGGFAAWLRDRLE